MKDRQSTESPALSTLVLGGTVHDWWRPGTPLGPHDGPARDKERPENQRRINGIHEAPYTVQALLQRLAGGRDIHGSYGSYFTQVLHQWRVVHCEDGEVVVLTGSLPHIP